MNTSIPRSAAASSSETSPWQQKSILKFLKIAAAPGREAAISPTVPVYFALVGCSVIMDLRHMSYRTELSKECTRVDAQSTGPALTLHLKLSPGPLTGISNTSYKFFNWYCKYHFKSARFFMRRFCGQTSVGRIGCVGSGGGVKRRRARDVHLMNIEHIAKIRRKRGIVEPWQRACDFPHDPRLAAVQQIELSVECLKRHELVMKIARL